jgi:ribosomal protein L3
MKVVRVDAENNIVMVRGGIPGAKNGMVVIQK